MANEIQTIIATIIGGNRSCSAGNAGEPWDARGGAPVRARGLWADFLSSLLALIAQDAATRYLQGEK